MERGKINLITLILLLAVILVLGTTLGYVIARNSLKKVEQKSYTQNVQEFMPVQNTQETSVVNTNTQINTNTNTSNVTPSITTNTTQNTQQTQIVNYEGSKTINIKGKTYKISYNSDIYEYDNRFPIVVNLYFNDKNVRCIDMPLQYGIVDNGEKFNKEYSVELYNIKDEYIIVVIKSESKEFDYEYARLCVLNLNGEFIGSREWSKGPESVNLKSDNKNLVRYEILEDGFLIFERMTYATSYCDTIYTIKNNSIDFSNNRIYNADEIIIAGK